MRLVKLAFAAATLILASTLVQANWVASGQLLYEHREWDATGFTGVVTILPVRYADVQVCDTSKPSIKVIGSGKTDASGNFSVSVADTTTRAKVRVKILTQTTQTSDLFVKVTTQNGTVYAANTSDVTNHGPNTNVSWGTMTVAAFSGGEAYNIFDLAIYGADYIKALSGS